MKYAKNDNLGGFGLGYKFEEWARKNTSLSEDEIDRLEMGATISEDVELLTARCNPDVIRYCESELPLDIVIVEIPYSPEELTIIDIRGYETIALKTALY